MIRSMMLAGATAAGMFVLVAPASAAPVAMGGGNALAPAAGNLVEQVQYRRYGYGPRYGYRGGYYGPRYRYNRGAAIGAGIAAGAVGALAAGALLAPGPVYAAPAPVYPAPAYVTPDADAIAYCSRRFRTYDPSTGTYIGNGGVVRACP